MWANLKKLLNRSRHTSMLSTTQDIFAKHCYEKVLKACRVACASFALDDFIWHSGAACGMWHLQRELLYMARKMARINLHFFVWDCARRWMRPLSVNAQTSMISASDIRQRSMVATVFSEKEILPLRFQHLIMVVAYLLLYLMQLPNNHYMHIRRCRSLNLPCIMGIFYFLLLDCRSQLGGDSRGVKWHCDCGGT